MARAKAPKFPFAAIEAALVDDFTDAVERFHELHPKHRFYGFALFTSGELSYVAPTAFSEEGLAEVASTSADRSSLRWSAADSPHHDELDFESVDMAPIAKALRAIDVRTQRARFDAFVVSIHEMFYRVLKTVDDAGCFGTGRARAKIFVSVMMGDQDDSVLALGKRLNPPATYERYRRQSQA